MNSVFAAARAFVSFERLGWIGVYCIIGAAIFAVVGLVNYGSYLPLATRAGMCVTGWNASLGFLWLGTITFVSAFAAYLLRGRSRWMRLAVASATGVCVLLIFPFQFGLGQCWPSTDDPEARSLMIYVVPFDLADRNRLRVDAPDQRVYDVDDPSRDWSGRRRRNAIDAMIAHDGDNLRPEVVSAIKDRSTPTLTMRMPQCIRQSKQYLGPVLFVLRQKTSYADPFGSCLPER